MSDPFLPTPKAGPVPPQPIEGDTNPGFQVDPDYVKRKVHAARAATRAEVHSELRQKGRHDWFRTAGVLVVVLAGGLVFVDKRVEAQTDGGMRVQGEVAKAHDARLTTLEKRFDRYDAKMDRQSELLELVADQVKVSKSSRPPPVPQLDGGR